ncbi:MAG: O-succinylbenzoic acid--CoA ligase [Flavobacteria bacterium RIFCSPLOWO2_12_FULL_35_11]|nr:MAG: O-succinylbenzoic acid--CoA ligase [Flavobacteria bacterium RIFCSPLOWO2_12_FULL_35_11]
MKKNPYHSAFKLQGKSFSCEEELIDFSKEISVEVADFLTNWFNATSFVEVKTSGSTGNPKIIQLQKSHMINSAKATGEYFNLPENTTALLCMSTNYIAGKMMLVRALTLGWHLDVVEPTSNPLKNSDKIYDFSAMVSMQLHNSLADIHKIKKLIVGGGTVSNELLSKIQEVKTEIFATYGMTETITHIAVKKLNVIASGAKQSYYKTLPNIKIAVNHRGCLVIDAPTISAEKVVTNDLVELISPTEFKWLGRIDNVINSGGIKLIPEQIEEKLAGIIENRFFVAGKKDKILGEKMILIIEELKIDKIKNSTKALILSEIKNSKLFSTYEIPKEIYFLEKFIETETKKIDRAKTLEFLKNSF